MPRKGLSKAAILEAAGKLVDRDGAESLTLTRLAEVLGIRPPSLFNHFGSLAELRTAMALRTTADLADALEAACAAAAAGEGIRALLVAYRAYVALHPGRYGVFVRMGRATAFADPDFVREEGRILELGFKLLDPYGLDRPGKVHALRGIRSLAHGFAELEGMGGFGLDVDCDESFAVLAETLVAGLEARKRERPRERSAADA